MSPLRRYQLIHDLLVDHLQDMTHQGRIAWLEQGDLRYLVASLTPDQPTTVFVSDLLTAAYLHGGGGDASLRKLVVHLRGTYEGYANLARQIDGFLQESDVGQVLFPRGVRTWAEGTMLVRAQTQFQRLPTHPTHPIPDFAPLPTPNNMRLDRNENFVGREAELRAIAVAMKERSGAVVAAGIGGGRQDPDCLRAFGIVTEGTVVGDVR